MLLPAVNTEQGGTDMTTSTTHYSQQNRDGQQGEGTKCESDQRAPRGTRDVVSAGAAVVLAAVVLFAVVSSGFGSTGTSSKPTAVPGQVSVSVTAPTSNSVIASDRVLVRGTVVPANADVEIQGKPAAVGDGVFTGTATLHGGKTTIDVVGSYPGSAPGATSVVIARQSTNQQPATTRVLPASPAEIVGSSASDSGIYAGRGTTNCGGDLSVGPSTSCPFAEAVRNAYESHGPGLVEAYSPVTNQTYEMNCSAGSDVVCTGGNDASVSFPASEAAGYSPAQPEYSSPSSETSSGGTSCGGNLSVGPNTTCAFAENVRAAYESQGPGTVTAYSPVTHGTYSMTCTSGPPVACTGGNDASVYFP